MISRQQAQIWIDDHTAVGCGVISHDGPVGDRIRDNLINSVNRCKIDGEWAEFGVKNGRSFDHIREHMPAEKTLHGFDTFEGLPEEWEIGTKGPYPAGILKAKRIPTDTVNTKYWVGLFADQIPVYREQYSDHMAFVHIDGDLYSSCNDVLYGFNDRIVPGTVLVFDDFMMFETCDTKKWHNIWNHECRSLMEWCHAQDRDVEMFTRTNWMQASFRVLK